MRQFDNALTLKDIATAMNLDEDNAQSLLNELDWDWNGEYIDSITEKGFYLMDLACSINGYTMIPIPPKEFKEMLVKRKLRRFIVIA